MRSVGDGRYVTEVTLSDGSVIIRVEAEDDLGQVGTETIEIATHAHVVVQRKADGSDADAIEAWEDRGLLGTQLGPNRNGKKW